MVYFFFFSSNKENKIILNNNNNNNNRKRGENLLVFTFAEWNYRSTYVSLRRHYHLAYYENDE